LHSSDELYTGSTVKLAVSSRQHRLYTSPHYQPVLDAYTCLYIVYIYGRWSLSVWVLETAVSPVKTTESVEESFWGVDSYMGPSTRLDEARMDATWRIRLSIERSELGGLSQCRYHYCSSFIIIIIRPRRSVIAQVPILT